MSNVMNERRSTMAAELGPPILTPRERQMLQRLLSFPLDLPGEFVTWLEDRMRLLITAPNVRGLAQRVATVGEYKLIAKDLSASVGLTTYDDSQGRWLYCNGASFTSGDYPDLESLLGGTTLPDFRGQVKLSTDVVALTIAGSLLIKA